MCFIKQSYHFKKSYDSLHKLMILSDFFPATLILEDIFNAFVCRDAQERIVSWKTEKTVNTDFSSVETRSASPRRTACQNQPTERDANRFSITIGVRGGARPREPRRCTGRRVSIRHSICEDCNNPSAADDGKCNRVLHLLLGNHVCSEASIDQQAPKRRRRAARF